MCNCNQSLKWLIQNGFVIDIRRVFKNNTVIITCLRPPTDGHQGISDCQSFDNGYTLDSAEYDVLSAAIDSAVFNLQIYFSTNNIPTVEPLPFIALKFLPNPDNEVIDETHN